MSFDKISINTNGYYAFTKQKMNKLNAKYLRINPSEL